MAWLNLEPTLNEALIEYFRSSTELNNYMLERYKRDEEKREIMIAKLQSLMEGKGDVVEVDSDVDMETLQRMLFDEEEEDDDEDTRP